jgi:23S rRNA (uridine2552-2'-O)-methyltransferase
MRLDRERRGAKTTPLKKKKAGVAKSGDPRWDHFAQQAKNEGYASRAVYKLAEIDRRFKLFTPGARVLDLGCAPGGWTQYAAEQVGLSGKVVGIDRVVTEVIAPQVITMQGDLLEDFDIGEQAKPFDVVLSDMAPDTTGIRHVDQDRSDELARVALEWASRWGKPGSAFVAKLFQGGTFQDFLTDVRAAYGHVKCVRPEATRRKSIEVYVIGQKKKSGPTAKATDPS